MCDPLLLFCVSVFVSECCAFVMCERLFGGRCEAVRMLGRLLVLYCRGGVCGVCVCVYAP